MGWYPWEYPTRNKVFMGLIFKGTQHFPYDCGMIHDPDHLQISSGCLLLKNGEETKRANIASETISDLLQVYKYLFHKQLGTNGTLRSVASPATNRKDQDLRTFETAIKLRFPGSKSICQRCQVMSTLLKKQNTSLDRIICIYI